MKLGLTLATFGRNLEDPIDLVLEAERLGYESLWTAEAYGSDAISPLAWVGGRTSRIKLGTAIMQIPARTPAMTAMTAMTMDSLSGGRFLLGLGASGPQVVEGWHGVAYGKPLARTREYIQIVRKILAREAPLEFEGSEYRIPYAGSDATGFGRPLKSILHGRPDLPIYTASISPAGLRTSGEAADGVLVVWTDPDRGEVLERPVNEGLAKVEGKTRSAFDLTCTVPCIVGDDLEKCRIPVKMMLALYIGGMGSRGKNFYNDHVRRLGYEEAGVRIQDLYLDRKKAEAVAAVPDELVDRVALVGPADRIRDRAQAWNESPVDTILVGTGHSEALRLLAEIYL